MSVKNQIFSIDETILNEFTTVCHKLNLKKSPVVTNLLKEYLHNINRGSEDSLVPINVSIHKEFVNLFLFVNEKLNHTLPALQDVYSEYLTYISMNDTTNKNFTLTNTIEKNKNKVLDARFASIGINIDQEFAFFLANYLIKKISEKI